MRSSALLLLTLLVIPFTSNAFGQNAQVDPNSSCQVIRINEIHTPFRIAISHDPAIKKSITDQKDDPKSALTLEGADPQAGGIDPATHLAFSSNSTDNWTITVNLDYKTEKSDPRLVIVDFYQDKNQQLFLSQKLLNSGLHFCGVFILHAIPAPHIYTSDEILAQAGKIEEEKFVAHDQAINNVADRMEAVGKSASLIGVVSIFLVIVFIVIGFQERSFIRNFNRDAINQRNRMEGSIDYSKLVTKTNDIQNILARRKQVEEMKELVSYVKKVTDNNTKTLENYLNTMTEVIVQHMRNIDPVGKINLPVIEKAEKPAILPEEIPDNSIKSLTSKIFEKGKDMLFEKKSFALEDKIKEFKKPEYRNGKLSKIYNEAYDRLKDDPDFSENSQDVLIIEAITFIVKENNGLWP